MHVTTLIDPHFPTIESDQLVLEAVKLMKDENVESLPVLERERFVGMVHARNLVFAKMDNPVLEYTDKNHATITEEVLTQDLFTFNERYIPVVSSGIYKGCIDCQSLLSVFHDELKQKELIIDHSYDGMLITDADGYILHINKAFERMGLIKKSEIVGMRMTEVVHRRLFQNESVVMKTLQMGKPYTNIQKFHTGLDTLVTATPVFNDKEEVMFVLANVRDISELTRLQQQLDESIEMTNRYQTELKQLRFENMKSTGKMIAYSPEMQDVLDLVFHVASSDSTVLLLGESGVGKDVIAKVLHEISTRSEKGTFMKVNCGAIPMNLLESEFFGYEQGAFTGAKKGGKPGIFELAHNGTLFLDEIGELPLDMQVKLLRVLQEQEIMRVGGTRTITIDVRIIAATNRDLEKMVQQGTFRQDLYYRLNVVPIKVPPLRDRKDDIIPLLGHFLKIFNEKYHYTKRFSNEVVERLLYYRFPGNVRELSNLVERLVLTCREDVIDLHHLPKHVMENIRFDRYPMEAAATANNDDVLMVSWDQLVQEENLFKQLEKEALIKALKKYGSVRKTGKAVGLSHTTVLKKMKKFGITLEQIR
jgi:PAS domain S-box-containing protein